MTVESGTPVRSTAAQHPHHWMIEPPEGRRSEGQCKLCGIRKVFANSNPEVMWERDRADADIAQLQRGSGREDFQLSDEAA